MPKILVRMATIFAPSWRKRCSTTPDISGDAWTVFFKSNSDALNSAKILVFRQQVIPSEARNLTNGAPVTREKRNVPYTECVAGFRLLCVIFRGFERSLASLGMTTQH